MIAVTLVNDLTVRDEASLSANPVGALGPAGEAVFVVSGPVSADGHYWYQLARVGEAEGNCALARPPTDRCHTLFGWAAGTGADSEPWLAPWPSDCPAQSLDTATYVSLAPLERLACFGDATWTLRAFQPPPTGVYCGVGPFHDDPVWLDNCAFVFLQAEQNEYESGFAVHVHPEVGACPFRGDPKCPFTELIGQWIEVRGHLDDPAALNCVPPITAGDDDPELFSPDLDAVVLDCRAQFVASSVTPSDPP
jgi:hypothetical protein